MSAENLQYEDFWYIKLNPDSKLPAEKWGGYGNDPNEAHESDDPDINLYDHGDVLESDHMAWGIAGIKGAGRSLLIYDLDIYKADDFDPDEIKIDGTESVPVVKSPSCGLHVYTAVYEERADGSESDFSVADELPFDIDIRESFVKAHVVAPNAIPGVGGDYELTNDVKLMTHSDVRDSVGVLKFAENDEPIISYDVSSGVGDFGFERAGEPPEDMPTYYHAGLQLRHASPDDHPNAFKVNTLTAMCGIAAGYDVDAIVDHFVNDFPPDDPDERLTRQHVERLAKKFDRSDMLPPAISTLREWGILAEDESCTCSIDYHGKTSRDQRLTEGGTGEGDDPLPWEHVRGQYADEGHQHGRYYAAQALEDRTAWMNVLEEDRLWVYDGTNGTYNAWGKQAANRMLEHGLGEFYSTKEKNEVIARVSARNQVHREEINGGLHPRPLLCAGNCVIDLETGDLLEHDPEYKFTRGLQWDYDPETADTEPVLEFLDGVTTRTEDRDTILDHLAHGLMPGHPYRAFVMMYGPGSNGKTQVGQLLRGFVGSENAASIDLPEITGGTFATGALPGKFLNFGDENSVSEIRDATDLKSLTSGGTKRANEKFEKQFDFENEATMFFAANEPPRITEEKEAIADRLYPIEMPYKFKGENEYDPDDPLHKRMVTGLAEQLLENEAAMKGLLVLCVEHAKRLIETDGQYSMPEGPAERRLRYKAASDPIARFALRCFEKGEQLGRRTERRRIHRLQGAVRSRRRTDD